MRLAEMACACGRMDCDNLNRRIHENIANDPELAALFGVGAALPERYWMADNGHHISWTTAPDSDGYYWARDFKPVGKGARTNPTRWMISRESRRRKRKDAKALAYRWYQAAAVVPS